LDHNGSKNNRKPNGGFEIQKGLLSGPVGGLMSYGADKAGAHFYGPGSDSTIQIIAIEATPD
jgi:hypothetical protein